MSFFNKKEEVIEIQLTKYGKESLANGNFKPSFYSFFDKDIIYDAETYGLAEAQNDIQERILESVLLKISPNCEESSQYYNSRNYFKLNNSLGAPIGTSNPDSNYAPAWDINLLSTKVYSVISSSDKEYNKNGDDPIPQINLSPTAFDVTLQDNYSADIILGRNETIEKTPKTDPNSDRTYIKSKAEDVIIVIEEKNSIDIGENFEVEFFYVDDSNVNTPLTKLNLYKQRKSVVSRKIIDDMLVDELEDGLSYNEDEITLDVLNNDRKNIGFYFNVQADNEISIDELNLLSQLAGKRLFVYDPITGRGDGFNNNSGIGGPTSGVGSNVGDNPANNQPRNINGEGENC